MTEYDYSPKAYEAYLTTQARISQWIRPTGRPATPSPLKRLFPQQERGVYRSSSKKGKDRDRDLNQDKNRVNDRDRNRYRVRRPSRDSFESRSGSRSRSHSRPPSVRSKSPPLAPSRAPYPRRASYDQAELRKAPVSVEGRGPLIVDYTKSLTDVRNVAEEEFQLELQREKQWVASGRIFLEWNEALKREQHDIIKAQKESSSPMIAKPPDNALPSVSRTSPSGMSIPERPPSSAEPAQQRAEREREREQDQEKERESQSEPSTHERVNKLGHPGSRSSSDRHTRPIPKPLPLLPEIRKPSISREDDAKLSYPYIRYHQGGHYPAESLTTTVKGAGLEQEAKRKPDARQQDARRRRELELELELEARRLGEAAARKEEETRGLEGGYKKKEQRKRAEQKKKEEEVKLKEAEAKQKELEAKRKEEETRRKEEETRRKEKEIRKKEEDAQKRIAEASQKAREEIRLREKELCKREEELKWREKEANLKEAERLQKALEAQKKEEEIQSRHEKLQIWEKALHQREQEANRREAESLLRARQSVDGRLRAIFQDQARYKRLLDCPKPQAQTLLDFFQTRLDNLDIKAHIRRNLIVAMQRLSKKTNLYPTFFSLDGVTEVGTDPVATGGFADIYKGRFEGQFVCLKMFRVYESTQVESVMKHFSREAILWGQLSHPNLLPFYGLYHLRSRACLVSPWVENGHINQYLDLNPNADRVLLSLDTAKGVQYLHNEDIIHGDLKGVNILVDSSGRACVADFGLSAVTDSQIMHWTSHSSAASSGGSVRWQAPELLNGEDDEIVHNSKETDVYALSCVCYEIFTGCPPFHQFLRDSAVLIYVMSGNQPSRPPPTDSAWTSWGLTDAIWELMEDCWKRVPADRPVVEAVISRLSPTPTERLDDRPAGSWANGMSAAEFRNTVSGGHSYSTPDDIETILSEFF